MKWVETIRVCTAAERRAEAVEEIRQAVARINAEPPLVGASVYCHAKVDTDILVLLQFESTEHQPQPCDHAIRLSAALTDLGFVEHSRWIGVQKSPRSGSSSNI